MHDHRTWPLAHGRAIALDRVRIVGILNITPDSFSDGGELASVGLAVDAARRMLREGADMLDIGGESTRPGAARVHADEQLRRVLPVIRAVREACGDDALMSIDTTLAPVAAPAIEAGAHAINDVSACTDDADMLPLAARTGAGLILMHRLAPPSADSYSTHYAAAPAYPGGVVACVREFLTQRIAAALAAGVRRESLVLDPGLGFGKSVEQNLELIARTSELAALGLPILSGLSRKSFTAVAAGLPRETPPRDRLAPTLALSLAHLHAGASLFRVHDVAEHAVALLRPGAQPQTNPRPSAA
ncbi:MAG TPA: dihydropteroate synthase [Phycisphaerales bacterium]|nr:dihydropteroate synthase [Phycisphaerales bacterium]